MTGKYLSRLKEKIGQTRPPYPPSKPSKGAFEGFEGHRGRHLSPDDADAEAIAERASMAASGDVPDRFNEAYAVLQVRPPRMMPAETWLTAINDAGLFLDAFGREAVRLRWSGEDICGPAGVVWQIEGREVYSIDRDGLWLCNGIRIDRPMKEARRA